MNFHAPLIIDIAGTELSKQDRKRLKHPLVGGLILFARNWSSREQLTALCHAIKKVRKDLLICVDHEGGRVQRFKTDGFTHLPPMRALGQMWAQDGKGGEGTGALRATRAATACGYVLGAELRACGVDLSFTPVLDLDFGESSVIGDRAFARDPRLTDNCVQFTTRRYRDNPLVVQGPGAGPEVTAAGVFSDLLRLAAALGARL